MAPGRKKGANRNKENSPLSLGDLVLAKVKGFPAWPAKISKAEDWQRAPDPKKYFVQFFGTSEIAFVAPADIQVFTDEAKSKLAARCQGKTMKDFARAVKEICEAFEELQKNKSVDVIEGAMSTFSNSVASTSDYSDKAQRLNAELSACKLKNKKAFKLDACQKQIKSTGIGINRCSPTKKTLSKRTNRFSEFSLRTEMSAPVECSDIASDRVKQSHSLPASKDVSPLSVHYPCENDQVMCSEASKIHVNLEVLPSSCSASGFTDVDRVSPGTLNGQASARPSNEQASGNEISSLVTTSLPNYENSALLVASHIRSVHSSPRLLLNLNKNKARGSSSFSNRKKDNTVIEKVPKLSNIDDYDEKLKDDVIHTTMQRRITSCDSTREASPSSFTLDTEINSDKKESSSGFLVDRKLPERNSKFSGARRRKKALETSEDEENKEKFFFASNTVWNSRDDAIIGMKAIDVACKSGAAGLEKSIPVKLEHETVNSPSPMSGKSSVRNEVASINAVEFIDHIVGDANLPVSKKHCRERESVLGSTWCAREKGETNSAERKYCKTSLNEPLAAQVYFRGGQIGSDECEVEARQETPVHRRSVSPATDVDLAGSMGFCHAASSLPFDMPQLDTEALNLSGQIKLSPKKKNSLENVFEVPVLSHSVQGDDQSENALLGAVNEFGNFKSKKPSLNETKPGRSSPGKGKRPQAKAASSRARKVVQSEPTRCSAVDSLNFSCKTERSKLLFYKKSKASLAYGKSDIASIDHSTEKDFLAEKRFEASKDMLNLSSVASVSAESSTSMPSASMKDLIAAAQARRRETLSHSVSGRDNSMLDGSIASPSIALGSSSKPSLHSIQQERFHPLHAMSFSTPEHDQSFVLKNLLNDVENCIERVTPEKCWSQRDSLSGDTEAAVARDAFEGMIETLSRTKESIGRATRLAIDCAKYGIANEVVELLVQKLENEPSYHRRIDLFFLVDSITQCSHNQKGIAGACYIPIVQAALPRLLGAAAPPGSNALENRRQCHKVLRLWLERKIMSESFLRRHIDDLGVRNEEITAACFLRRPSRTERSVDDPIREMDGMHVDEYGSNVKLPFPGLFSCQTFDEYEEDEEYEKTFVRSSPSAEEINNTSDDATNIVPDSMGMISNDKQYHILEEMDGELEMENIARSPCRDEATLVRPKASFPSSTLYNFDEAYSESPPYLSFSSPPLPSSPPPVLPPPPPFSPSLSPPPPPLSPPPLTPPPPPLPPPLPPGAPPFLPTSIMPAYLPPAAENIRMLNGDPQFSVVTNAPQACASGLPFSSMAFMTTLLSQSTVQDAVNCLNTMKLFETAGPMNNPYKSSAQPSHSQHHLSQHGHQTVQRPHFLAPLFSSTKSSNHTQASQQGLSSQHYTYPAHLILQAQQLLMQQQLCQSYPLNALINGQRYIPDGSRRDNPDNTQQKAVWGHTGRPCSSTSIPQEVLFKPPLETASGALGFQHHSHASFASSSSVSGNIMPLLPCWRPS